MAVPYQMQSGQTKEFAAPLHQSGGAPSPGQSPKDGDHKFAVKLSETDPVFVFQPLDEGGQEGDGGQQGHPYP